MLILGDTRSAIDAIMMRRMKVPIYCVKTGNGAFDRNMPEEIDRRIVDHLADFNLSCTGHARGGLLSAGIVHTRIYVAGSPRCEMIDRHRRRVEASDVRRRPGALDVGFIVMRCPNVTTALEDAGVAIAVRTEDPEPAPHGHQATNAFERVLQSSIGTARLSNMWHGAR